MIKAFKSFSTVILTSTILVSLFRCDSADEDDIGYKIGKALPLRETSSLYKDTDKSDADDPSFWIHPSDHSKSLVICTAKDGRLRVYNLQAEPVQDIVPSKRRFNNVDVIYGFPLSTGTADLAVATDRKNDSLAVWRITDDLTSPLSEITSAAMPRMFPTRPGITNPDDPSSDVDNPVDDQHTCYGLALYKKNNTFYAFTTQRTEARIGRFILIEDGTTGTVTATYVRDYRFPYTWRGQDLRQENDTDPLMDWNPQFEGLVVDRDTGMLYAAQENVGIWQIDTLTDRADDSPFYETRGTVKSTFDNRDSVIARDVEGLTIWYGKDGSGYLLASSQGKAHGEEMVDNSPYDDTFVVFNRKNNRLLGGFSISATETIDMVQECDGLDISPVSLPGYEGGLVVAQDGYDNDNLDGDPTVTNFKFVAWSNIAAAVGPLDRESAIYDPRD